MELRANTGLFSRRNLKFEAKSLLRRGMGSGIPTVKAIEEREKRRRKMGRERERES